MHDEGDHTHDVDPVLADNVSKLLDSYSIYDIVNAVNHVQNEKAMAAVPQPMQAKFVPSPELTEEQLQALKDGGDPPPAAA